MTREYRLIIGKTDPKYATENKNLDGQPLSFVCYFQIVDYVAPDTGEVLQEHPQMTYGATKLEAINSMIQNIHDELEADDATSIAY